MTPLDTLNFVQLQHAFIDERPTLAAHNTDPLAVLELLKLEIAEFEEAYRKEFPSEEVAREAADIAIFTVTLFKTLALDLEAEVIKKIRRNQAKYPIELFQNVDFEIAASEAKKRWITLGGDLAFYTNHIQEIHEQT